MKESEIWPKDLFDKYLRLSSEDAKTNFSEGRWASIPRPPLGEFEAFYSESPSARFWVKEFFPVVVEARREKIFRPNAEKIQG